MYRILLLSIGIIAMTVVVGRKCHAQKSTASTIGPQELPAPAFMDYFTLSLEELLKLKASGVTLSTELEKLINSMVSVASQKAQSTRKSPSVLSILTEEEITASGARDLIDVLRLVPGFQFAVDVQNVVGLGVRGNWAAEGKVLLLLDGQEMNETLYSSLQFGNKFDISQIKRIEIIRGPGSAIYGGFAEYAVISIITKNYNDLNGFQVTGTYGTMQQAYARRNISFSAGKKIGNWGVSLALFAGQGQRSDQTFNGFDGSLIRMDTTYDGDGGIHIDTIYAPSAFSMKGNSQLNPFNINLGVTYKNLNIRAIYDDYHTTQRDGYGSSLSRAYANNFRSFFGEIIYTWKLSDKLTLTPRFNVKRQMPWQFTGHTDEYTQYHKQADRLRGNLTLSYDISRRINLIAGGEFFNDTGTNLGDVENSVFYNGSRKVNFSNRALFTQTLFKLPIAYLTIGMRYDYNDAFGSAFVPRLGITRKFDKLHFKILYSNSFRAPSIENINLGLNNQIKPEKSRIVEAEVGYQLNAHSFVTLNLFDVHTTQTIIFNYEAWENYQNFPQSGSSGLEMEYRLKKKGGFLTLTYAFYTTAWKREQPALYSVPGQKNVLLAFPAHAIGFNSSLILGRNWSINPSGSFQSSRYGYVGYNEIKKFAPVALVNCFLQKQNILTKGLNMGLGIYDMLNQKYAFIQPYNGGHAPMPGTSREFLLRLTYTFHSSTHTTN